MKTALLRTLALVVGSSATTSFDVHHSDSDSAMARLRCGAVNFLMTAFLPTAHTTAFCSAYLQVPEQTATLVSNVIGKPRIMTETSSIVVPTITRTLSTTYTYTSTTTVDLWNGHPACTSVPKFEWVRDWRSQRSQRTSDLVKAACSCLEIPESTITTTAAVATSPTVTVTEGITGLAEVTSVKTHTVIKTQTKYTFLSAETASNLVNRTVVFEDKSLMLPRIDRVSVFQSDRSSSKVQSSRAVAGAMMAGVVRQIGSWKQVIS